MKRFYLLALTAAAILTSTVSAKHCKHNCQAQAVNIVNIAKNCDYNPMKHALKHGSFSKEVKNQALMTAMDCSGKNKAYYLVELLLKHDAQPNCSNAGCPLHKATAKLDEDLVKLLLGYNAAAYEKNSAGQKPSDLIQNASASKTKKNIINKLEDKARHQAKHQCK